MRLALCWCAALVQHGSLESVTFLNLTVTTPLGCTQRNHGADAPDQLPAILSFDNVAPESFDVMPLASKAMYFGLRVASIDSVASSLPRRRIGFGFESEIGVLHVVVAAAVFT